MENIAPRLRAIRRHLPLGFVALAFLLCKVVVALYLALLVGEMAPHILGLTDARTFVSFELPILFGIGLVYLVLAFAGRYSTSRLREELAHSLRLRIHHHMLDAPLGAHHSSRVSERIETTTNGVDELSYFLATVLPSALPNILLFVGAFFLMWNISPGIGVATVILAPLAMVLVSLPRTMRGPGAQALHDRRERIGRTLDEHLRLITVVKSHGGEFASARRFAEQSVSVKEIARRHSFILSLVEPVANAVAVICVAVLVALLCRGLVSGVVEIGGALTFCVAGFFLVKSTRSLAEAVRIYADIRTLADRIFSALLLESELTNSPWLREERVPKPAFARDVHFRHLGFSYDIGLPVLSDVSFEVKAGEFVAITGPNGAGKSTLLQLLLRFYEPTRGEMLIGDRPIQTFPLRDLRGAIGYLPQQVQLFADTVWNNIVYGAPEATLAQVEEAAAITGLNDVVRSLPHRYDTVIGTDGIELSAGQAQRVALTRAIVRDAPILVLDEPSGPLDFESERVLVQGLRDTRPDRTLILVTHRPSILELADRTVYVANGKLVDRPAITARRGRLFSVR